VARTEPERFARGALHDHCIQVDLCDSEPDKGFGKPTGEFDTVEQANEEDAIVKWDDDGRMRVHRPWLKKVSRNKVVGPVCQI
jgi:hypothetical protein